MNNDRQFQGIFRPLIDRLWAIHAQEANLDPRDKPQKEFWYRDFLCDSIGVATTKGISQVQQRILIDRAKAMLPAAPGPQPDPDHPFFLAFSPAQNKVSVALARKAYARQCQRGDDSAIALSLGKWAEMEIEHDWPKYNWNSPAIPPADRCRQFDEVMLHFAILANDTFWLKRTADADEIRLRFNLRRYLTDLSWLYNKSVGWDYLRGIWRQADLLPARMEDAPAATLRQCLAMLDTHIRRVCKRRGIELKYLPTRKPKEKTRLILVEHEDASAVIVPENKPAEVPF